MAGVTSLLRGQRLTVSKTYIYINIVVLQYIYSIPTILIYLCHVVRLMPTITIYLTNDLYDKVRDAPSKTVRAALEYYFKDDNADEPGEEAGDTQPRTKEHTKTHVPPTQR